MAPEAKQPRLSNGAAHPENQNGDDAEEMDWSDEEGTTVDGIHIPPPAKRMTAFASENRLIITKISNNFFKSYAEDVVLGPFSKCFNAIIGPNGSGKSNVIDAMLFVFGYRAAKIRSKKLSVLLHNSERHNNIQSCTVTVHFCEIKDKPGEDYDVIPGSEFSISRTAFKDNSSQYTLNGRRVQFKEVAQLLRKHGVDLDHNRFLILQGEVEEISMMKCKGTSENETGMLEYLEDIIGTSRYKKPLSEISDRIEHLSVVRIEKLNRLKLIEQELDELKEPMKEAIAYLKLENTVVTCQNFIFQRNLFDLQGEAQELDEEKLRIADNKERFDKNLKALSEERAEKEKVLKDSSCNSSALEKRKNKMSEARQSAQIKEVQLKTEMNHLNKDLKKIKEKLAEDNRKLSKFESLPENNAKEIAKLEKAQSKLQEEKEELETQKQDLLVDIREDTQELQQKKGEEQTKLSNLLKVVNETKSAYEVANTELKLCQSNEENEANKLEQCREAVAVNETNLQEKQEVVNQLKKKIPLTEKSLQEATSELNVIKCDQARLINDIKMKRSRMDEMQSSMQQSRSRGRVVDALMQQKRDGKCPGLYGRLGDLGAIDAKYDVAVSTACGPLDNIVVDNAETALWCIDFLKKHNTGRATFIVLEKQEYLRDHCNNKMKTPENVHRLFDLIRVQDEAVRTAFYYGLRDTLVADDLTQASRIAYGVNRHRVVTLKGELIEISGTMSGGGRSVLRGRMGQSVAVVTIDPKEIEDIDTKIAKCENQLREINKTFHKLEGQVNTLAPELNQMKSNYERFSRELELLKQQKPALIRQLKMQEAITNSTKSDAKQVQKLTAIVEQKKVELDKASQNADKLKTVVDKLTKELDEKTTGRTKPLEKRLQEVTNTLSKNQADVVKLKVAINTCARDTKKCIQNIEMYEKNIENAESRLVQIKEDSEEITNDLVKLDECLEQINSELEEGSGELSGLKKAIAALIKEENKLKMEKIDIDHSMKQINEKLGKFKANIHQWHAKLGHLRLHDIPEETRVELKKFSNEELESHNIEPFELELNSAQQDLKKSNPNLNVLEQYERGQNVYLERSKELDSVTDQRNKMKDVYDKVKNQRKSEFMAGYHTIKLKLKEMYQLITLGGDADFDIVDAFDPFSEGIQFNVRPPKKTWKNISNLSGGEKTLSSLALVFALHHYRPSPLYVMDEIDAALDFKNVSIVGHYIKERTRNTQFIIISLRSNMFELCDNLIGIYKVFSCTSSVTVNINNLVKENGEENQAGPENDNEINEEDANNTNENLEESSLES